eukprot:PLAT6143.1.p1 GENE.PLAT6143.1~~PLAT6143.1.p1  ORF type:complete len:274 (-),score=72.54 PLAT6143.1:173-949(-)
MGNSTGKVASEETSGGGAFDADHADDTLDALRRHVEEKRKRAAGGRVETEEKKDIEAAGSTGGVFSRFRRGGGGSHPARKFLSEEEVADLEMVSQFTEEQVLDLYRRFQPDPDSPVMGVSREQFLSMHEVENNPYADRLALVFELVDEDSRLDFRRFLERLSDFTSSGSKELKMRHLFAIYDMDGDGKIGRADLREALSRGSNLSKMKSAKLTGTLLDDVVDQVFREASTDEDYIEYAEFSAIVGPTDYSEKLVFMAT